MHRIFQLSNSVNFILSEKKLVRLRDGYAVKLRSPASFCLLLLLEKQGQLVSHNELFQYGWERFGMSASLNVLHNTVYHLRKSLSEVGGFDNNIIETINRRGFIFTKKIQVTFTFSAGENGSEPDFLTSVTDTIVQELPHPKTPDTDIMTSNIHVDFPQADLDAKIQNSASDCISYSNPSFLSPEEKEKCDEELCEDISIKSRNVNILLLIALSILTFIILWQVHQLYSLRTLFPAGYTYTGNFEKCQVYQNKGAQNFMKLKFIQYMTEYCTEKRFLYITSYIYSDHFSAISCTEKISFFSNDKCISNYLIYDNAGAKSE